MVVFLQVVADTVSADQPFGKALSTCAVSPCKDTISGSNPAHSPKHTPRAFFREIGEITFRNSIIIIIFGRLFENNFKLK